MSNLEFTDLKLKPEFLDKFYIRKSILEALSSSLHLFSGKLLDTGCGSMPYKQYILLNSAVNSYTGLDIESALEYDVLVKPDVTWNGISMPFEDNSFETVIATEVLEHCPDPELVMGEMNRVLKKGGIFFFTVPFIWNLHETPYDEYRYTPFSLERHLKSAGFENIKIKATGGWHASLAQMLGLWVRRSPITKTKRRLLSVMLKPIIGYLIKKDNKNKVSFVEGQMITGLYGTAQK